MKIKRDAAGFHKGGIVRGREVPAGASTPTPTARHDNGRAQSDESLGTAAARDRFEDT